MRDIKAQREINIKDGIDIWKCINCDIETNYSSEGVCYWCFQQMSMKHNIEHFTKQIEILQKRKQLIKTVDEEEEE